MSSFSSSSARKKWPKVQSGEEIIQKVWDCIRTSNGIMVCYFLNVIFPDFRMYFFGWFIRTYVTIDAC